MTDNPQEEFYVPLGLDCVLAYQLKKLDLRKFSLPFDWISIKNIQIIINILNDDFKSFIDKSNWLLQKQSHKFNFFEDNKEDFNKLLGDEGKGGPFSLIRMKHKIYDLYLPHEAVNYEIDLDLVIEKYKRRIERFRDLLRNPLKKKKIFLGYYKKDDKKDDKKKDKINSINLHLEIEKDKIKIEKSLLEFGAVNFNLLIINYNDYDYLILQKDLDSSFVFDWKRNYIDFQKIFSN